MTGLFQAAGIRFCIVVSLLFSSRFVDGLVATTKNAPAPFTKRATLPPLDIIPTIADWESDEILSASKHDYSGRLPIVYTNELAVAEEWIQSNLNNQESSEPLYLGWDMESSPYLPWLEHMYTKDSYFGPATLQLSTSESALVLQIAQDGMGPIHEGGLPSFLHELLENPNIIPVGVGIDDDFVELYRWCLEHGDDCAGPAWGSRSGTILKRFDIGGIGSGNAGSTIGLARLVAGILGVVLPKSKKAGKDTLVEGASPLQERSCLCSPRCLGGGGHSRQAPRGRSNSIRSLGDCQRARIADR
mmetsp:Transcript_11154/g.28279  ORF Transcript_11154/g.28279 Transcript_11154/m.28279 type:complete len:302 (+) Transcript_11154:151-1056(+)